MRNVRYVGLTSLIIGSSVSRVASSTCAGRVSDSASPVDRSVTDLQGYYKVGDIHPAHAFLSLPDKELPVEPTSQPLVHALSNGHGVVAPRESTPEGGKLNP